MFQVRSIRGGILVLIFIGLSGMGVTAMAADGSIVSVDGNRAVVQLDRGVNVKPGDEMEVNLNLGGESLYAGRIKVERVQGGRLSARIVERKMAIQKGMSARLVSPAVQETVPPAATASAWQDPDKKPTPTPMPEAKQSSNKTLNIASGTTRTYAMVWNDAGSGARRDFATFRPRAVDGYYPLGDVAITEPWTRGRYAPPIEVSLLVKDGELKLARPVGYRKTWDSRGSRSNIDFSSWEPIPPEGFVCLGEVGIASLDDMPSNDAIRCIPQECARQVGLGDQIWKDSGSGATLDFSAWQVPGLTTYIGYASHRKPQRSAYTLKRECIE